MLTEQTVERLRTSRLGAIADAYLAQQRDTSIASLSFGERLGMLVDAGAGLKPASRWPGRLPTLCSPMYSSP